MNENNPLDFSMIMASAVHDMKNSLGMLLNTLEEVFGELPKEMQNQPKLATLQYEAERVNNDLIQLLGIYRLENQQLRLRVDEQYVSDFIEEQAARYETLFESRGIKITLECEADCIGYFDHDLVAGILNNTLANAARYTKDEMKLTAGFEDGWLVISLSDNGRGYPQAMIDAPGEIVKGINFQTGSTSLGLFFSAKVAALHSQGDKRGRIELSNGGELGGGIFKIYLP
ncbi:MAG: HAMP domain-containing histidine kinase [Hahellaceae bacterium]|nr:HAMP domain-containing histidine kinase [Hahellaceae bacterium]MCP5211592.1 HAMP domain-containing histidine kinase [Hahellaceae bacterium]